MPDVIISENVGGEHEELFWQGSMPLTTDYVTGPANFTHEVDQSATWGADINFGGAFKELTGSLDVNFSETYTDSEQYQILLADGERARITYTPNRHWIHGTFSMTTGGDPISVVDPFGDTSVTFTPIVQVWGPLESWVWFPIPGGVYRLDYALPALWTRIQFQGTHSLLPPGAHNHDETFNGGPLFPNDQSMSLSVPQGFQVELFGDRDFQGPSVTLGPGEIPVFSPDWTNQVSSVIVTGQEP
jgi:hypothetical protein